MNLLYLRVFLIALAVGIGLVSLLLAFRLFNPTPPNAVTMITGPEGGTYHRIGALYRDHLAKNGVQVELLPSSGAVENLERLRDGSVDFGFVTMGTPDAKTGVEVRSLGAMFYEPLWFFARDAGVFKEKLDRLFEQRISIGPKGSRSNAATRYLFSLNGLNPDQLDLKGWHPERAFEGLESGELDAMATVSGSASPLIKRLLALDAVELVDFERAAAYEALFPELTRLVVPAGVGSLSKNLPPADTQILAFTSILATHESMHPITQSLFLDAAARIHAGPDLFQRGGVFPAQREQMIPLSDAARAYYTDGKPLLLRILPYWLSVLVMQVLVAAVPIFGVFYPLLKLFPKAFHTVLRRKFYSVYGELRQIDRDLRTADSPTLRRYRERLEDLDWRAATFRVPVTYASTLYALRAHISAVRTRVAEAQATEQGTGS